MKGNSIKLKILLPCLLTICAVFPFFSLLSGNPSAFAGKDEDSGQEEREAEAIKNPPIVMNPFRVGEKYLYDVKWMGISAGSLEISVRECKKYNPDEILRTKVIAETSPFFSAFFEVKDVINSCFETENISSVYFEKKIREGKYHKDQEVIYDQEKHVAYVNGEKMEIPPLARDPVATLSYLRTLDLRTGKVFEIDANSDGKNYTILVKIHQVERIKIGDRTYDAYKAEPLPTFKSKMIEKGKSKLLVWLTADERRIPVRIKVKVKIGSIIAEIVED